MSNFIQTLVCKVFSVPQWAGAGSGTATWGTMPDTLNKATCYLKIAEEVAKQAECVAHGPIRRHYCEIANSYLAAARAELSYAEQETARRRIVASVPSERVTAPSAPAC